MTEFPADDQWTEGIYFNLPEDRYHALPWIGSSGMKKLFSSPPDFWWESAMNKMRPKQKDTESKAFGTALHHCVLHGRESFDEAYDVVPGETGTDVSAEGLKIWLEAQGSAPAKLKADRVRQVRDEFGLKGLLTEENYNRIILSAGHILKNPSLAVAFQGGWPEVSIFWRQEGVPCKCRIDYLKPRANVDIKSFRDKERLMTLDQMVLTDLFNYRYDIQAAHYLEGRKQAKALAVAEKVYGTPRPAPEELKKILAFNQPDFIFVFYKANGAPIAKAFPMPHGAKGLEAGRFDIARAIEKYLANMQMFGTDAWVCVDEPYFVDGDKAEELYGRY